MNYLRKTLFGSLLVSFTSFRKKICTLSIFTFDNRVALLYLQINIGISTRFCTISTKIQQKQVQLQGNMRKKNKTETYHSLLSSRLPHFIHNPHSTLTIYAHDNTIIILYL